jgi:hypothetical protein
MAMLCTDPLGVGTNMSFGDQGTIPSQLENPTFICACAFEHIATLTHPLPSCQ